jgi:hypothetical protein
MDFQVLLHRSLNILEGILSFRKGDQKISEEKQTDTLNSLTSIISLMDEKLFNRSQFG